MAKKNHPKFPSFKVLFAGLPYCNMSREGGGSSFWQRTKVVPSDVYSTSLYDNTRLQMETFHEANTKTMTHTKTKTNTKTMTNTKAMTNTKTMANTKTMTNDFALNSFSSTIIKNFIIAE